MAKMRAVAKSLMHLVSIAVVLPLLLIHALLHFLGASADSFTAVSQLLSLLPGKSGSYLRVAFYRHTMRHCSADSFIGFGSVFSQTDTHIGSGVYIGPQCNIGGSRIGNDCLLGSAVHVLSGKKQHSLTRLDIPVRDQGGVFRSVAIGEDTWVGNGAIIMADVGAHCVVGAGSVVIHEVADFAIVSGNPAKAIGSRIKNTDVQPVCPEQRPFSAD